MWWRLHSSPQNPNFFITFSSPIHYHRFLICRRRSPIRWPQPPHKHVSSSFISLLRLRCSWFWWISIGMWLYLVRLIECWGYSDNWYRSWIWRDSYWSWGIWMLQYYKSNSIFVITVIFVILCTYSNRIDLLW